MRSLFAFCKKTGKVFRNPTRGIKVGQRTYRLAQRLDQDDVDLATEAATTPAARLVLMLAAVHAARTESLQRILALAHRTAPETVDKLRLPVDAYLRHLDLTSGIPLPTDIDPIP